jgi:hypothetical protein
LGCDIFVERERGELAKDRASVSTDGIFLLMSDIDRGAGGIVRARSGAVLATEAAARHADGSDVPMGNDERDTRGIGDATRSADR